MKQPKSPDPINPPSPSHLNGALRPTPDKPNEELAAVLSDHHWLHQQYNAGALEQYAGEFIAVWEKQVVAHAPHQEAVRTKAAQRLPGVPAERFAVSFIEKWD